MKKFLSVALSAALAVSMMAACGSGNSGETAAQTSGGAAAESGSEVQDSQGSDASVTESGDASSDSSTDASAGSAAASGEAVTIGVIQYTQHASLDEAYEGFKAGLEEAGYVEGENLTLDFQNASGDTSTAQTICDNFKNSGVDLVLAIATPAAQSAANTFSDGSVPVVFTAVTDAVEAQLVESNEAPGKNVTGTLDMPVIADQIQVIRDILPDAKTLGILYTSSEANSEIQAQEAQEAAEALGFEVTVQTASNTNEIQQTMTSVVGSVDAVYIPSDNGFASAMGTVNQIAVDNQLPVFCAVEAMIQEGGIATTAINYFDLGKQTAAQAVRILGGESASEVAVETQQDCGLVVNKTFAESVGVTIPDAILDEAVTVY